MWVVDSKEPEAMGQYALGQGVPDEDTVLDYAGQRDDHSARYWWRREVTMVHFDFSKGYPIIIYNCCLYLVSCPHFVRRI